MEFNVYDMLVFETESGSIYQDCVCSVCNDITNNGYSAPFHKAIICERFIIDFKEEDENTIDRITTRDEILEDFHTFKLKEIWTRIDEDTYKKVYELVDGKLTKISYIQGMKVYHKRQVVTYDKIKKFMVKDEENMGE